jgi:hypothetical protein
VRVDDPVEASGLEAVLEAGAAELVAGVAAAVWLTLELDAGLAPVLLVPGWGDAAGVRATARWW